MELREDKLRGVREIAGHIGESERRTVYMLERKQIPGFKIGRIWYSTRTALRECFTGLVAGGMTATVNPSDDVAVS